MIDTQFDFAIGIPPYNGGTRQYKEYQNVIWETSVKKYESKDGEKSDVVTSVQKYQLKLVKAMPNTIGYESLVVSGSPPQGTKK